MATTLKPEISRTVACSVAGAILRRALLSADDTSQGLQRSDAIAWAADTVDRCHKGNMTPAHAVYSIRNLAWDLPENTSSTRTDMTREALLACALVLDEST